MTTRRFTHTSNILEKFTIDKETALANMKTLMSDVFMDAQKPGALLQVDAMHLRDIQVACCLNSPRVINQPEDIDFNGESRFLQLFFKMMNIIIRAKRKDPAADRAQRFLAVFIQHIQSKGTTTVHRIHCVLY